MVDQPARRPDDVAGGVAAFEPLNEDFALLHQLLHI